MQTHVEMLFGILQQKGCTAYTARALDAYHAIAPINRIHERTAYRCIEMLHQISVR